MSNNHTRKTDTNRKRQTHIHTYLRAVTDSFQWLICQNQRIYRSLTIEIELKAEVLRFWRMIDQSFYEGVSDWDERLINSCTMWVVLLTWRLWQNGVISIEGFSRSVRRISFGRLCWWWRKEPMFCPGITSNRCESWLGFFILQFVWLFRTIVRLLCVNDPDPWKNADRDSFQCLSHELNRMRFSFVVMELSVQYRSKGLRPFDDAWLSACNRSTIHRRMKWSSMVTWHASAF
jgi:hypothetical protein